MPTMLENLMLEEVSLVDKGASIGAHVTLFKRDSKGENMSDRDKMIQEYMDKGYSKEDATKMCDEKMKKGDDPVENEEFETLKSDHEKLKGENERLRKALLDEGYVISKEDITKKAPEEFIEYEGEKINKADIPAPILKKLEEAEAREADAKLEKRAEESLPNFNKDAAKKLLSLVEKSDDVDILMEALAAADKAFEGVMEEYGKADVNGDMSDPQDKLDALVKSYMEVNEVKKATAYAAVAKTDEGKALVNEIYKKG